jgi:hypothetical protein
LCDRLSRGYGWTLREILELTPRDVLLYVDVRRSSGRVFVSTREAREIATAAREQRRAWVERELRGAGAAVEENETCGDWERLVRWSARIADETPVESDATPDDERDFDSATTGDGERLRQIHDELRMIRAALVSDKRAWRSE